MLCSYSPQLDEYITVSGSPGCRAFGSNRRPISSLLGLAHCIPLTHSKFAHRA
jgi:hypothetical protein